ncbi:MAG TPA: hypothetical protein VKT51_09325 [Candidatus Eremiobacteraceae bacterium]|nr:hypothetical protein [Candidatus Eremiobacteraceae bacterium]
MLISLVLAAALIVPDAARLPARCNATAIARVIAVCATQHVADRPAARLNHDVAAPSEALVRREAPPIPAPSSLAVQLRR